MTTPWDRQPGESAKAFEAFRTYVDLGSTRSLMKTGQRLAKNRTTIGEWSVKWRWQERLAAWDTELSHRALDAEADERREMARRHARLDQLAGNKIAQRLIGDEANGIKPIDVNTMTWSDIRGLLEATQKLERLARGAGETQVDINVIKREAVAIAVRDGIDPEVAAAEFDRIMAEEAR